MDTNNPYCSSGSSPPDETLEQARKRKTRERMRDYMRDYRSGVRRNRPKTEEEKKLQIRNSHLHRTYGITPEQYDAILDSQHGHCAICGDIEPGGKGKHFHIDHDHVTGQVRGLLCSRCNHGLGMFRDSILSLESAIVYLRSFVPQAENENQEF